MAKTRQIKILKATAQDAAEIAAIYNEGIDERCATFVTTHFTPEDIRHKLEEGAERHPFYVAIDKDSKMVVGWVSISSYSPRGCYDGVGEVSVYIKKGKRRQGIGEALVDEAYKVGEELGYWKLMVRIFAFNEASTGLFKKMGYVEAGLHKNHGKLGERWLDVLEMEKSIPANLT